MPSFANCVIMGHLTRDPETKTTTNGTTVCEFSLAVNEYRQGEEVAHFFDIVTFGKNAENLAKYQTKGSCVLIEGRPQQDRWQDKESGQNRNKIRFIASRVQYVNKQGEGASGGISEPQVAGAAPSGGDDDIPF
jgi:single-strand DNA-binding protein